MLQNQRDIVVERVDAQTIAALLEAFCLENQQRTDAFAEVTVERSLPLQTILSSQPLHSLRETFSEAKYTDVAFSSVEKKCKCRTTFALVDNCHLVGTLSVTLRRPSKLGAGRWEVCK